MQDFSYNLTNYLKQAHEGLKEVKKFRLSYFWKVFSLMGKKEKILFCSLAILATGSFYLSIKNLYQKNTHPMPDIGGAVTEGLVGQPNYINPVLAHSEADLTLTRLVFSGLYQTDTQGRLIPDLAENLPQISSDQKEYTVNLKRNVKWHNDRNFNADDVVFTIQTIQDSEFKSPYKNLWQSTTVEKINDFQVKFKTKDISGPFLSNLTQPILSRFLWQKIDSQKFLLSPLQLKAVGTGPYKIKEIQTSGGKVQSIALELYPAYHKNIANIAKINFNFYDSEQEAINALSSGEISALGLTISAFIQNEETNNQKNIRNFTIRLPQYQTLFFNLNHKILSELTLRKILQSSINTDAVSQKVFGSYALSINSPFMFTDKAQPATKFYNSDTEGQKKLLENLGYKLDTQSQVRFKKNQPLEIKISAPDTAWGSKTAEEVAKQWQALGVKTTLEILPSKDLNERVIKPRKYEVLVLPINLGADPDPFYFWHSSQVKEPGYNLSGLTSVEADKLINEGRAETNQSVRQEKYLALEKLIENQALAVFLTQNLYIYSVSNKVQNINLKSLVEPSQKAYDLPNWYIETKRVWK